ncbi:hypothetical protein SAMD00019534_022960, partial [Acytostelium subglobosum LB1]|uniref:hypothetical protein n=1 Tax=Acytostelium subglobosum LB1 TaxID=1410327 RepID=UPI0006448D5A
HRRMSNLESGQVNTNSTDSNTNTNANNTRVEVVALDLGGVVFSAGKEVAAQSWERRGYDSKLIKDLLVSQESMDLRKGKMSDDAFWNNFFKQRIPADYDVELIRKIWYDGYVIDHDIVSMMQRLKSSGYIIVAFSGNIPSRIDYLEQKYNFRRYFDIEVYSFDFGYTKPDIKFIEALIKAVYPDVTDDTYAQFGRRIAYIDDNVKDAEPSKQYNIPTFIYRRGEIDALKNSMSEAGIVLTGKF